MNKFRLKMDMSQFYNDERNLVYILVDPKWEQVLCLEEHVEKLFDVPKVHFITDDGVYIPPRESIDIIKSSDFLRAIGPQKINKKNKRIDNTGFGDEQLEEDSMEILGDKRKHKSEQLTCSTPTCPPRKKKRISPDVLETITIHDNSVAQSQLTMRDTYSPTQQCGMTSDTASSTNDNSSVMKNSTEQDVIMGPPESNEETAKTRKRKRTRRKKKQSGEADMGKKENRLSSVPVPISSSTLKLSKSIRTPDQSLNHIHFDESESSTLVEQDAASKKERVIYRCHLTMNGTVEPREIEAEEKEDGEPPCKQPALIIHENVVLVKGKEASSVIEVDDSVTELEDSVRTPDNQQTVPSKNFRVDEVLPHVEPLVGLPKVGAIIVFKVYRLDRATCAPVVSEYICGRCEEVNASRKTMNVLIMDGFDQIDLTQPNPNKEMWTLTMFLDQMVDKQVFRVP